MNSYALIAGAVLGGLFAALAYWARRHTKRILVRGLIAAALVYVLFAVTAHAGAAWIAGELLGVVLYGGIARGLRGSAWWIAAGWALHPIWDIALHFVGPGHTLAPEWYTVPCVTWDLVVAAVVAIDALRGQLSQTRGVPRLATR